MNPQGCRLTKDKWLIPSLATVAVCGGVGFLGCWSLAVLTSSRRPT
jgi:hypothetical protein